MMRIRAVILAAGACLSLAGCVIVSDNRARAPEAAQAIRLARLEIGTPYETVLERFGPPQASSARKVRGVECRYLRYPLHGDDSRADTVQLVFRGGRLIGWGAPLPDCPGPDPEA